METFHEDILQTFLFCFLASSGIIQVMIGARGWHGLSIYGGRVRRNVNNALGAALIIFAYAYYFSDPLHRNVRNIEGLMSLLCLALGVIAASAATVLLASLSEALRRRLHLRDSVGAPGGEGALKRIPLENGEALLSSTWGTRGENLVVFADPGKGSERFLDLLFSALPAGRGMLSLRPEPEIDPEASASTAERINRRFLNLLHQVEELERLELKGETFMGLDWNSNLLLRMRPELERDFGPRELVAVAPIIPDFSRGFAGDALLSNTPLDIGGTIARMRPWMGRGARELLRLWWPVFLACVVLGTLLTCFFDVRWKYFSGPLGGLIASLWLTYFLAAWRGKGLSRESYEENIIAILCTFHPAGGSSPLKVVVTSEEASSLSTLPEGMRSMYASSRLELWEDTLRGKFLLREGTLPRLNNLIWREKGE